MCVWKRLAAAHSRAPAHPAPPPPARYQVAWPPVWCEKTNRWAVATSTGRAQMPRMDMRRSVRKHLALRLLLEERQRRLAKLGDVFSGEAREEMQVLVQCGGGRSRRHGHASPRGCARPAWRAPSGRAARGTACVKIPGASCFQLPLSSASYLFRTPSRANSCSGAAIANSARARAPLAARRAHGEGGKRQLAVLPRMDPLG